tara:strand:+ start:471 stop:806 length:336 start_codon:yes stop_codon:yes gene_type:complete
MTEKARLLETLRTNLETHVSAYRDAMRGYRAAMIVELEKLLAAAQAGRNVDHELDLERPSDHSDSYEQAILLMEWETRDELELSVNDFECYVCDNWDWSDTFRRNLRQYKG